MTDAYLMDVECVHGEIWYDCLTCEEDTRKYFEGLADD